MNFLLENEKMKIFSLVWFVDAINVTVRPDAFAVRKLGFFWTFLPFDKKQALRGSNNIFSLILSHHTQMLICSRMLS